MTKKERENAMGQLIRIVILSWSAALLTGSYAGLFAKMDPTFIATVFTASAATFGINTLKRGADEEDEKNAKRNPEPQYSSVEPTPELQRPVDISTEGCPECGSGDAPDYSRATINS